MAKFTTAQANNCIIQKCDSRQTNGIHNDYLMAVTDDNGRSYRWTDSTLSATATAAKIKTAVIDYLTTIEKIPAAPIQTKVSDKKKIVGKKVSNIK